MKNREFLEAISPVLMKRSEVKVVSRKEDCNGISSCMYRKNGKAEDVSPSNVCFVGALIKPEYYKPGFEKGGVFWKGVGIAVAKSIGGKRLSEVQLLLLADIQAIHDEDHPEQWKKLLTEELEDFEKKHCRR